MTLRSRLWTLLLLAAPAVWLFTLLLTVLLSRQEIDESFDTRQVRLAQQVLAMLPPDPPAAARPEQRLAPLSSDEGQADLEAMAISVTGPDNRLAFVDREGERLPRDAPPGFLDTKIDGVAWRVYTLVDDHAGWRVTVGQLSEESTEVLQDLLVAQAVPLLVSLPLLLAAMAWAVRRALQPLDVVRRDLLSRAPTDFRPLDAAGAPGEILPLLASMNALLLRVEELVLHERRLVADAAHELRTPLAALSAQWEAAEAATDAEVRTRAQARVGQGIQRLSHLVGQLLMLATAESAAAAGLSGRPVNWMRVVEDAMSDCLPLIERSNVDIEVQWPAANESALPVEGSEPLLATLLRNLLDNALRYSPPGARVRVRFSANALSVQDDGPGMAPAMLRRAGDRFYRPAGQTSAGSGLGLSIVRRIAELHGLTMTIASPPPGAAHGVIVELHRGT